MFYRSSRGRWAGLSVVNSHAAVFISILILATLAAAVVVPSPNSSATALDHHAHGVAATTDDDGGATSLESFYATDAKVPPDEESYFESNAAREGVGERRDAAKPTANSYRVAHIEFDSARSCRLFKVKGSYVFNRFGHFADVFLSNDDKGSRVFKRILRAPGIVWIERPMEPVVSPPPRAPASLATRQPPEQIVRGGFQGLTGKGVTIAFIDSGADFRNLDFIKYDSEGRPTSRLMAFYDTTSDAYYTQGLGTRPPFSYPNGVPLGTLYLREHLTADLRSSTPRIPVTDVNSHGTAVTGIAAGNGNNDPHNVLAKGVAPDADIIAVRVGSKGDILENAYLLNAIVDWLDKMAGSTPLVVSCSFGSHTGGHDGYRLIERQLDARFTPERKGRALVISAGNEANMRIHAEVVFKDKNAPGVIRFTAGSESYIDIYLDSRDSDDIFLSPTEGIKKESWLHPLTKQLVMRIHVPSGDGELRLFNRSGKRMEADAYVLNGVFKPDSFSNSKLISSPGTTRNAITPGSYDFNDYFGGGEHMDRCGYPVNIGRLSCYSSPGYTRMGVVKPDIAAPGQYYYASYARMPDGSGVNTKTQLDETGKYCLFSGTSAATPYTAGVVALLLQKKPELTLGEIKELMRRYASSSYGITGNVPNPRWGYGKLDLAAIERMIKAVKDEEACPN